MQKTARETVSAQDREPMSSTLSARETVVSVRGAIVEIAPIAIILVGLGLVGLLLIGPGCGPPL